jgi:hypothetical protein
MKQKELESQLRDELVVTAEKEKRKLEDYIA